MGDSEARARAKLAEADKKARGGGGFFSKVFGSGGQDDAADLYIQAPASARGVASTPVDGSKRARVLEGESVSSSDAEEDNWIECAECEGCSFSNEADFAVHYAEVHSFRCETCVLSFSSRFLLDIHLEEHHSPFFKIAQERGERVYRCMDEGCEESFNTEGERNGHGLLEHGLSSLSVQTDEERRRKMAGNLFKMAKLWKEAGDSFVRAAEIKGHDADAKHDVASQYSEAGNCYRKTNPQFAVECLQKTADIYTDMGRFTMAAKVHVTMAELFENECPDMEQCIFHYQKAADYYKGEESKSSATKCLVKVAMLAAQLEQYNKAVATFEEIAMWEAEHPTLKYAAKTHFFQALICRLNIDLLDSQHALSRYEEASPSFTDTRECKLIKEIIASMEANDEEAFTKAVAGYDKISKLDNWHTALLVKVKRAIASGGAEEDEDDMR